MVFVRHGLGDLVRRARIATLLEHAAHVLHWGEATKIAYLEVQQRARLGARLISGEGATAERCCFGVLVSALPETETAGRATPPPPPRRGIWCNRAGNGLAGTRW